jgi:hypothetical protein
MSTPTHIHIYQNIRILEDLKWLVEIALRISTVRSTMAKLYVVNWRLLIGSILGFLGTFAIAMDKIPQIHQLMDRVSPWAELNMAMSDLNHFDERIAGGDSVGLIEEDDPGFTTLVEIICASRRDQDASRIRWVLQNAPASFAGIRSEIVHLGFRDSNNAEAIMTRTDLNDLVVQYRERWFLSRGLWLVIGGFFFGILGRLGIRRRRCSLEEETVQ